jgi:hypothetical protein
MEQNFKNHSRYIPLYHMIIPFLLLVTTIGAFRNLFQSFDDDHRLYNASLITMIVLILWVIWFYARAFALRAQDRVIMLEERARYQQLTGRPMSDKFRPSQIIALRFAGDAEFPRLAERTVTENLGGRQIKEAIKQWRADRYRV